MSEVGVSFCDVPEGIGEQAVSLNSTSSSVSNRNEDRLDGIDGKGDSVNMFEALAK